MEQTITIPKKEYDRLKKHEGAAEKLRQYLRHARDIEQAREDIREGRVIEAEELYKQLGI